MNTLSQWAYHAISKHFNKIVKHENGVLANQDIEQVHQMRVGMRRLRSAIDGFGLVLQLPKKVSAARVGKISRILGELRDLDVMSEMIESLVDQIPNQEIKHLDPVFKSLKQDRQYCYKKVKKLFSDNLYIQLKQELKKWLDDPSYTQIDQVDINFVLPDILLPQISNFFLYPTWYFPASCQKSEQYELSLHALRKQAKKLRYNLELFEQEASQGYQYYLQEVTQVQTILGDIQDNIVLREFLKQTWQQDSKKTTPTLSDILQKNNLQHWQAWQNQSAKFLSLDFKKSFYLAILNSPTN